MTNIEFETAKLLAHFKVQARRSGISVDLSMILNNPTYAAAIFHEVEETAEDEDLLVTMLRLRTKLAPVEDTAESTIENTPQKQANSVPLAKAMTAQKQPATKLTRDYRFGARG